jgi:hypothetical protein
MYWHGTSLRICRKTTFFWDRIMMTFFILFFSVDDEMGAGFFRQETKAALVRHTDNSSTERHHARAGTENILKLPDPLAN